MSQIAKSSTISGSCYLFEFFNIKKKKKDLPKEYPLFNIFNTMRYNKVILLKKPH